MIYLDTMGREIQLFRGKLSSLPTLLPGQPACAFDDITNQPSLWVGTESDGNVRVQAEQYIIDDLVSNNPNAALSAKQGKILKDLIDAIGEGGASTTVVDNLDSQSPVSALSARQGNVLDGKITAVSDTLNTHTNNKTNPHGVTAAQVGAPTTAQFNNHVGTMTSKTAIGHVKVGAGINVTVDGTISVPDASTTQKGIAQLNNTLTSTSTTQAATINTVKILNDTKANKIQPNWIPATLQNGWTGTMWFYKDDMSRVHLQGVVNGTASVGVSKVFTAIGPGNNYKPSKKLRFPCIAAMSGTENNLVSIEIDTLGNISYLSDKTISKEVWVNFSFSALV